MSLKTHIEIAPNLFIKVPNDLALAPVCIEQAADFIKTVGPDVDQKAQLEFALPEQLIAYAYVDSFMPDSLISVFYDRENVDAWLRGKIGRLCAGELKYYTRWTLQRMMNVLPRDRYYKITCVEAASALDRIVTLKTKYRHSHTLRYEFRSDFGLLFPQAAELVKWACPMKNGPAKFEPNMSTLSPRDRSAYEVFTGAIPKSEITSRCYLEVLTNSADPFNP